MSFSPISPSSLPNGVETDATACRRENACNTHNAKTPLHGDSSWLWTIVPAGRAMPVWPASATSHRIQSSANPRTPPSPNTQYRHAFLRGPEFSAGSVSRVGRPDILSPVRARQPLSPPLASSKCMCHSGLCDQRADYCDRARASLSSRCTPSHNAQRRRLIFVNEARTLSRFVLFLPSAVSSCACGFF